MSDFKIPFKIFGKGSDSAIELAVIAVVMMLIIPLPTVLLDALMAINLMLALFVLLIVLYTKKVTDFSSFPTVLLMATIFGLALNVSSTRLILTKGAAFNGRMIKAFSSFVVGSGEREGLVVGFVIFIVIIAVQIMVITKGATRTAEVAARFTLDAMPMKHMALESEYNSNKISEEELIRKKRELQQETDFFGSMDGASKFISGNVKVGIIITLVNIFGGIIIGTFIYKEPISAAFGTYIAFSIGDGLLSQFPALLVSTATGILVTRTVSDGTIGEDVAREFSRNTRVYGIGAIVFLVFSFIPGFPWYVLIPLAVFLGVTYFHLSRRKKQESEATLKKPGEKTKPHDEVEWAPVVPLDPLSLELGYTLIPLVDREKGAELLDRVQRVRRETALELGLVIPRIRIKDNIRLEPSEYCFKIKGVEVGRGKIRMEHFLCINPGGVKEELPGEKTTEPAFGLPAIWVKADKCDEAERAGYTIIDPPSIIATHLTEIIRRHASELLGRQEIQIILDTLKKDFPAVVAGALRGVQDNLGIIQKVVQNLLKEKVSILNMTSILETLADYGPATSDIQLLTEKARQSLSRQLCLQYADAEKILHVLTIDPSLEQKIIDTRFATSAGFISALNPPDQKDWIRALSRAIAAMQEKGWFPIILCSEAARFLVKHSTSRELPELVVISMLEIADEINVEVIGQIKIESEIM